MKRVRKLSVDNGQNEAIRTKKTQIFACDLDNNDIKSSEQIFDNQEWLRSEAAAYYLGLSVGALRNMTSNGQVPYYKLGRRVRYRVDELRALLLQNRRGGTKNGN